MSASPSARRSKVLRAAVVVDEVRWDEVHQQEPGSVTAGSALNSDILLFGRGLPRRHTLFDYKGGQYFIDLPPSARGRISMRGRVATVPELRRRFGQQGGTVRVRLDASAKGKLRFGETTVYFRFARPAPKPPVLPFPDDLKPGVFTMYTGLDLSTLVLAFLLLGPYFVWSAIQPIDPEFEPEVDDRFKIVMGVIEEKEEKPEEEAEEETLAQEDEEKEKEKEEEQDKPDTKKLDKKPEQISDKARAEARGVALARALGTYGGDGEGTVFDIIQSTENRLDDVFAEGMGIGDADGGDFGTLMPGAEGMGRSGEILDTKGFDVSSDGPELEELKKRERVIKVKAKDTQIDGDVDKKVVKAVIRRKMSALNNCYNKALRTRPGISGRIAYSITISVMGTVTRVDIEDDTLGDPGVAECTKMRIRGWRFPSEGAEEPSDLSFSVVYSPQF
ncbi:MAG: AgmX/PglI C-terminal domain-containing protein [Myxococcales bacterium]|nr:AgmX/PglI C-terminal domain-containing protein [Myxococcales bacterium]MCB9748403.1 AgmX/PglI C-terminal domain-containing protein [Myxococcales bacterium]